MHPTPSEQLERLREVLLETVRPQVTDAFGEARLDDVAASLGRLARQWDTVIVFLEWDNRAMEDLLNELHVLPPALVGVEPGGEFDRAHERNKVLRRELVDILSSSSTSGATRGLIGRHLIDRCQRHP